MAEATVAGRPRDTRIDQAVLAATVALLEEVGYLRLSIAAVAERAGTTKPAIYRRWPTKAHLVHEAVFPLEGRATTFSLGIDLRGDIRGLVAMSVELLGRPAARAALPGLMAENNGAAILPDGVVNRYTIGTWGWLQLRIDAAIAAGEIRAGVQSSTVLELVAGAAFVGTSMRPREQLDDAWIDQVVSIIIRGITP